MKNYIDYFSNKFNLNKIYLKKKNKIYIKS